MSALIRFFCVGERISSMRTLLKLPNPLVPKTPWVTGLYFNASPYALPFKFLNSTPAYVEASLFPDMYTLISSLYLYVRGGIRLKYLDVTPVTGAEPFSVYLGTGLGISSTNPITTAATDGSGGTATTDRNGLPCHYYKAGFSGEVQVPAYGRYHSRLITDCLFNIGSAGINTSVVTTLPEIYVTRSSVPPVTNTVNLLRSASDDANCGVFLAVPPVAGSIL